MRITISQSFLSILFVFVFGFVHGQYVIDLTSLKKEEKLLPELNQLFHDFMLYTIDTQSWMSSPSRNNQDNLQIIMEGGTVDFRLEQTYLFDTQSALYVLTEDGRKMIHEKHDIKTYKGYTIDMKSSIRVTMADGFVYGNFTYNDESYFIEPLGYYAKQGQKDEFIIYKESNVKQAKKTKKCFRPDLNEDKVVHHITNSSRTGLCYKVNLAMLADYSMYIDPAHSGVNAVVNHLVGVINNVEDNYIYNGSVNFTDGLNFHLSEIVISTCSTCDPLPTQTNAGLLLGDFSSWVDQGGFFHSFHGAHFWTDRDLDGSTIGVAFQNTNLYCQSKGRALFQDWTTNAAMLKIAVSHEMGHTFSAVHDATNSTTIMAPTIASTNTSWSSTSKATISNQIAAQGSTCLQSCSPILCPPLQNVSIDNITNTHIHLSWTSSSSGLYTIKVRESGQSNFIVDLNTTSLSVALAPPGYAVCKKYEVFIYNNCGANGLSLPERILTIAPTSQGCADFAANKTIVWPGIAISFSDKSLNATSWLWNFGNGQTSTLQNPTINYTAAGSYNVSLTVNGVHTKVYNEYIKVLSDVMPPFTLQQGGDFESNNPYFASAAIEGTTDFWQLGTSSYVLSTSGKAWKTGLTTDISPVNTKCALFSPRFNFLGYQNFELHFDIGMEVQFCNAPVAGQIQYSINNGLSWSRLGNSPGFYNAGAGGNCKIAPVIFPDTTGWTFTANYVHKAIDISFLAGQPSVIFRFVLGVSALYNGGYTVDGILIDNFRIDASGSTPLAIDQNSLQGYKKSQSSFLHWRSLDAATFLDHFIIYRSQDGLSYEVLDTLNDATEKIFTYEDSKPHSGLNYYKVASKDLTGDIKYSNIVAIQHSKQGDLSIFPNPIAHGQEITIKLESDDKKIQHLDFFDMMGRKVEPESITYTVEQSVIRFGHSGLYTYKCYISDGNVVSGKITIL